MIAAVLAGAVMFGVFIRPSLVHDRNLPVADGRAAAMSHTPLCRPRTERFGTLTVQAKPDPKCTHNQHKEQQQ